MCFQILKCKCHAFISGQYLISFGNEMHIHTTWINTLLSLHVKWMKILISQGLEFHSKNIVLFVYIHFIDEVT